MNRLHLPMWLPHLLQSHVQHLILSLTPRITNSSQIAFDVKQTPFAIHLTKTSLLLITSTSNTILDRLQYGITTAAINDSRLIHVHSLSHYLTLIFLLVKPTNSTSSDITKIVYHLFFYRTAVKMLLPIHHGSWHISTKSAV